MIRHHSDIYIQYSGGPYNNQLLSTVSSELRANLFYIELVSMPNFYSTPEICAVRVHCRVPPGPALLDLIFKLHRESTYMYYQGSESKVAKTILCTEESMQKCQNNQPFTRELKIEASSNTTRIRALIDGSDGKKYNISKCPYPIRQLIEDQGLYCVFGRRDQKQHDETRGNISTPVTLAQMELRKLLDSLT